MDKLYRCQCFFKNNYFIKKLNIHIDFVDKLTTKNALSLMGAAKGLSNTEIEEILDQLELERKRRKELGKMTVERTKLIQEKYAPLHRHVYTLKEEYFDTGFLDIANYCKQDTADQEGLMRLVTTVKAERVYSFPVFTEQFCKEFLEELDHFEESDMPKTRPNTMNNYGILLNELGFDDHFMTPLRTQYLSHISKVLYPDWGGPDLDSHKAFIVTYKMDQDLDLSFHFDNAEVTLNVSLGKDFEDGALYFGTMRNIPQDENAFYEVRHRKTHGLIHRGQHRHGAMPIEDGARYNLIIWMRSSKVRNLKCPMCDEVPVLVESEGVGDGFTRTNVDVCNVV